MAGDEAGNLLLSQAPRRERWGTVAAIVILALGVLVRIAYAYPAHKYVPDADSLNMGLRGLSILDGDLVVFYSGAQIGALEAYAHAATFALLGASRDTISLAPTVVGSLTLVVFFLFVRELLGPMVAVVALLFFAFPSPSYLAWTYMPNSYPETLFFCASTLWLAARVARRGIERWPSFALGLCAGLGWWNSPLTLSCTVPAFLWLVTVRREARRPGFWSLPLAGLLTGALPWILYNLRYRFPSIWQTFRPATGSTTVAVAGRRFFAENLPDLAVGVDPFGGGEPMNLLQHVLRAPAGIVYIASVVVVAHGIFAKKGKDVRRPLTLLALVALGVTGLFVFSASGRFPGSTVRYVLPVFLVLVAALAVTVSIVSRWTLPGGIALAGVVLLFNISGYYWPWTTERRDWSENRRRDEQLLRFLGANGVSWICGEYWAVYPFNFLSRGRLRAAPFETQFDFYGVGKELPRSGRPALVGRDRSELERWASRAGLVGPISSAGPGYAVLLPETPPSLSSSPERLYARLIVSAGRR
jgi:hypothetical protein